MTFGNMKSAAARAARAIACIVVMLGAMTVGVTAASAAGPAWRPIALADTTIAPGGSGGVLIQLKNVGDASLDASSGEMDLTVTLPAGLTATSFTIISSTSSGGAGWTCFGNVFPTSVVRCQKASGTIDPFRSVDFGMTVAASPALLPGTTSLVTVAASGGGAITQSTVAPIRVSSDPPGFGVATVDGQIADATGAPFTQAGGRPDSASVSFDLNTVRDSAPARGDLWPVETLRNVFADLPPGLVGDPAAVGQCTPSQLANAESVEAFPLCPSESQVGTALIRLNGTGLLGVEFGPLPVFNMTPPPNAPAQFGMNVLGSLVLLDAKVRPAPDYGITISVPNTPEAIPLVGTTVSLWGNPSDPSHNADRACPGRSRPSNGGPTCTVSPSSVAFLRNTTSCQPAPGSGVNDGLVTAIHMDSWEHSGRLRADGFPDLTDPAWKSNSFVSHELPGYPLPSGQWGAHVLPTGCNAVPFAPALSGQPAADAMPALPSGFSFDLTLPQPEDPNALGEGDLKTAVVTLPLGVHVSPSSADGLAACSSAQIDLSEATEPTCPDAAKIGTATIDTPLLPRQLSGTVYLAAQGDNPFGSLLAVYIVASGAGVVLKLPGHVEADPITGQLTTTFDNNPQLPFTRLHLEFKGGPRAPLVLPRQCGPYTTNASLTSWSGKTVDSSSVFTVNGDANDCSSGTTFAPNMVAGTQTPVAGRDSTFDLQVTRADRDQDLSGITVLMPSGLTGRIANADLCPDAQAAAGTCPAGSQVGSVTTGAGVGSDPFYISGGHAYLTGPYKGAPFGLSIVVPAKAGPFDLGNVVVRSALFVDRHTANVSVVSDPLPTVVQGIPLDVRDVRVSIDKPHFFVNPTSCAEKTIYGVFRSTEGWVTHASSRFQVGQCGKLALKPKMVLTVGAKHHTAAGSTIPLTTTLTMPRGNANLRWVSVDLPGTLNARLDVISRACTPAQYAAGHCSQAKAGSAVASTPLLRSPLRGNVYFVKNRPGFYPDLVVALRGQVAFDLVGHIKVVNSTRLTTTFSTIPDVPITKFVLRLTAGSRATLGTLVNLCSTRGRNSTAGISYRAQNGRVLRVDQKVVVNGCPKPKRR